MGLGEILFEAALGAVDRNNRPSAADMTRDQYDAYNTYASQFGTKRRAEELEDIKHQQNPEMQELAKRQAYQDYLRAQTGAQRYGQIARDENQRNAMSNTATQVDVMRGPGGALIDEAFSKSREVDPEFYRSRAQQSQRLGELLGSYADADTITPATYWGEGDDRPMYSEADVTATAAYNSAHNTVAQAKTAYAEAQQTASLAATVEDEAIARDNVALASERLKAANQALSTAAGSFQNGGSRYVPEGSGAGSYRVNIGDVKDPGDPFGKFTGKLSGGEREEVQRSLNQQAARAGNSNVSSMSNIVSNAMTFGRGVQDRRDALGRALSQATSFLPASRSGFDPMQVALGRPSTVAPATFTQPNMNVNNSASNNLMASTGQAAMQSAANKPGFLDSWTQAQDLRKGW